MKPKIFLPPLLALIAAGLWLVPRQRALAVFSDQNATLEKLIAARTAAVPASAAPSRPATASPAKSTIDWRKIAARIAEQQRTGDAGEVREAIRLDAQLNAMTPAELLAAIDEIDSLDLPAMSLEILQGKLLAILGKKDPQLALDKFIGRINEPNDPLGARLNRIFSDWVGKDLPAAQAWLDQQIAAGTFNSKTLDGKSQPRLRFEGRLLGALFAADPAAANRRLSALPADQRADAFAAANDFPSKPADNRIFAQAVREQLPAEQQSQALVQPVSRLINRGGYPRIAAYLDDVGASSGERLAIVTEAGSEQLAGQFSQHATSIKDVDSFRDWAATQAPDSLDQLTGKILAEIPLRQEKATYADAGALALHYQHSTGDDAVLATFLEGGSARFHLPEARTLAAKISDPARREAILKTLSK
jgi:hypothetical protein